MAESSDINTLMNYYYILISLLDQKTTYLVHYFSLYHEAIATTHSVSTYVFVFL